MPEWMHNRAEHLLAKNPSMPKSEAFAVATQQMHALGKGPKSYGTAEGKRVAKAKFDTPKDDVKAANPGHLESPKMASLSPQALLKLAMTLMEAKAAPHQALTDYMQGAKDAPGSEGEHLFANPEKNQLRALHAERMQATLPPERRVGAGGWNSIERRGPLPTQDITHGKAAAPGTIGGMPAKPVARTAPYAPVPTNAAGYSTINPSVLARPGVASYGHVSQAQPRPPTSRTLGYLGDTSPSNLEFNKAMAAVPRPLARTVPAPIKAPVVPHAPPGLGFIGKLRPKMASFMIERFNMLKKADAPENNEADTLIGTNHINQAPSETNGMDGGPTGYMWSQDIPPDAPSTSGRVPGVETLHTGAEKIVQDETIGMLRRAFTNYQEAARTDREQVSDLLVNGKPGTYVTRSKTLLTSVRDLTGRS